MADRDRIIGKIKKLMALGSDNPNANEAIAAALKAQRLIAEYDVTPDELHGDDAQEIIDLPTGAYKGSSWRGLLAAVVARNFRCRCYKKGVIDEDKLEEAVCRRRRYRVTEHEIFFYGYECDAQAAAAVYLRLAEIGEDLARAKASEVRAMGFSAAGVKNSFLLGFCRGVDAELSRQSEALMLVVPKEVDEGFENRNFRKERRFKPGCGEYDASREGRSAGVDAVRSTRLDGAGGDYLLAG